MNPDPDNVIKMEGHEWKSADVYIRLSSQDAQESGLIGSFGKAGMATCKMVTVGKKVVLELRPYLVKAVPVSDEADDSANDETSSKSDEPKKKSPNPKKASKDDKAK